jgi:hypothetical protein
VKAKAAALPAAETSAVVAATSAVAASAVETL